MPACLDTNKFLRQYTCSKPKKWAFAILSGFPTGVKEMLGLDPALRCGLGMKAGARVNPC